MCNEIKCAIQSTVDLINININREQGRERERGRDSNDVQHTAAFPYPPLSWE